MFQARNAPMADYNPSPDAETTLLLGCADRGFRGHIRAIETGAAASALSGEELEHRLIELGFVEGSLVEVLHEGPFGSDPIAVRVNNATIALRRREAMAIRVAPAGQVRSADRRR